jgi:hypothetical protein
MRDAFSLLLVLHGIAHLRRFLVPWRLSAPAEMPYTTALLGGTADLGDVGIRIVGLLWLFASIAFMVAGAATFLQDSAWWIIAITATLGSLALTVLGWPQSRAGLAVDLLLLVYLMWKARPALFPEVAG